MIRDVLYWPRKLRDKVKRTVQHFQQEELKQNMLAKTDLRDVIIVCVAEALPQVTQMSLQEFKRKVSLLKSKG
jgi:flagellar biosynthesis component FlhA